jgi:hypothetical protein
MGSEQSIEAVALGRALVAELRCVPPLRVLEGRRGVAYRRDRSHVEGEGWSGGAEKGR